MTSIEWTHPPGYKGETWNPGVGCTHAGTPGCDNCYAAAMAWRLQHNNNAKIATAYQGTARMTPSGPRFTGRVNFLPERLETPLRWRDPRCVFVDSMTDLFHEGWSDEEIAAVFGIMAATPQHIYQILTKRPDRALKWFEYISERGAMFTRNGEVEECFRRVRQEGVDDQRVYQPYDGKWPLPNVWIGVSTERQTEADERIPLLLRCPAAVRFVSCEPLLSEIDLVKWLPRGQNDDASRRNFPYPVSDGLVQDRQPGAYMAVQEAGTGRADSLCYEPKGTETRRNEQLKEPRDRDQVPTRDVCMGRAPLEDTSPSCGVDDPERSADSGRSTNQPQGRRRREQCTRQPRNRHESTERPPLFPPRAEDERTARDGEFSRAAYGITGSEDTGTLREGRSVSAPDRGMVRDHPVDRFCNSSSQVLDPPALSQVIAGGESGHGARPSCLRWFRDVRDQCSEAGVAFFMKQLTERGCKVPFDDWPDDLKIQEWPSVQGEAKESQS